MKRRMFIHGAAGAAIAMLAGCSGTDQANTQSNTEQTPQPATSTDTRTSADTPTSTQTEQTEESEPTTNSVETTAGEETTTPNEVSTLGISDFANEDHGEELAQHLRQTSNWDMDVFDYRGHDTVTVQVGENENGNMVFEPAAIAIDSGTTVKWEWVGDGEEHSIYTGGYPDFSTEPYSEAGVHTEQTFEEEQELRLYSCVRHDNMRGGIVIDGIEDDS